MSGPCSDWLSLLAENIFTEKGRPATAEELAVGVLRTIKASDVAFDDLDGAEIRSLAIEKPKRTTKVRPGDVVAIPAKGGGYHLAIVLDRNHFGIALGLLRGTSRLPRVRDVDRGRTRPRPVYTDEQLIAEGAWLLAGHDESLLSLFTSEPEIYHAPNLQWPGVHIGPYGSAESPSGAIREISRDEAQEVGLIDGTYRQGYVSWHLQQLLDDQS